VFVTCRQWQDSIVRGLKELHLWASMWLSTPVRSKHDAFFAVCLCFAAVSFLLFVNVLSFYVLQSVASRVLFVILMLILVTALIAILQLAVRMIRSSKSIILDEFVPTSCLMALQPWFRQEPSNGTPRAPPHEAITNYTNNTSPTVTATEQKHSADQGQRSKTNKATPKNKPSQSARSESTKVERPSTGKSAQKTSVASHSAPNNPKSGKHGGVVNPNISHNANPDGNLSPLISSSLTPADLDSHQFRTVGKSRQTPSTTRRWRLPFSLPLFNIGRKRAGNPPTSSRNQSAVEKRRNRVRFALKDDDDDSDDDETAPTSPPMLQLGLRSTLNSNNNNAGKAESRKSSSSERSESRDHQRKSRSRERSKTKSKSSSSGKSRSPVRSKRKSESPSSRKTRSRESSKRESKSPNRRSTSPKRDGSLPSRNDSKHCQSRPSTRCRRETVEDLAFIRSNTDNFGSRTPLTKTPSSYYYHQVPPGPAKQADSRSSWWSSTSSSLKPRCTSCGSEQCTGCGGELACQPHARSVRRQRVGCRTGCQCDYCRSERSQKPWAGSEPFDLDGMAGRDGKSRPIRSVRSPSHGRPTCVTDHYVKTELQNGDVLYRCASKTQIRQPVYFHTVPNEKFKVSREHCRYCSQIGLYFDIICSISTFILIIQLRH